MKKYLLCLMALCFLVVGSASFAESEVNVTGAYQKHEYLLEKTLSSGGGTYKDLYTQAVVSTDLLTKETACFLIMEKLDTIVTIGTDELEELLMMLPMLKDNIQNSVRGKTEYVYQTKSGVWVAIVMESGEPAFIFKLHPNDNTSSSTFDISVLDELVEYLNEYAVFFREESK